MELKDILLVILGPAGIWLGWFLQRRDKVEERKQRRLELLREKAEAIYEELVAVSDAARATVRQALADEFNQPEAGPTPPWNEAAKLKALLRMYFPDAEPILRDFEDETHAALQPLHDFFAAPDDGTPVEAKLVALKAAKRQEAENTSNATTKMVARVRFFMDDKVKTLF